MSSDTERSGPPPGLDLSAPPRREPGTRSRAGNAMARSRDALLDGAVRSLAERGLRGTSMSDVVRSAGVAKATAYNHFRTKDHLWHAVAERELGAAVERARVAAVEGGAAAGLASLARVAAGHPVLVRLRRDEPGVLARAFGALAEPAGAGAVLRAGLAALLGRPGGGPAVEAALRWLAGCAVLPPPAADEEAALLVRSLATAPPAVSVPGALVPAVG